MGRVREVRVFSGRQVQGAQRYSSAKSTPETRRCLKVLKALRNRVKKAEMMAENLRVQEWFRRLCAAGPVPFPQHHEQFTTPATSGVYVIYRRETVLHVGRTLRARGGLRQRLKDHLYGRSSFTKKHLKGKGATLRKKGYKYRCLAVKNARLRALVEAYAVGVLCPRHLGLGKREC